MDWGGADVSQAGLPANTAGAVWALTPFDLRDKYVDPTIMFNRLLTHVRIVSIAAVSTAFGIGVIKMTYDPDLATVPTEFPEPIGDPEADWLIHQVLPVAPNTPAGSTFTPVADQLIHSRARRRMGNNSGLLLVVEAAGTSFDYTSTYRYLLKE